MKNKIFYLMTVLLVIINSSVFAGGKKDSSANSSSSRYLFEQNFAKNDISKVVVEDYVNSYSYIPNIGFSAGKRVVYNGSVELLNYIIPDSSLAVLSKDELMLLRNTIYAKYGMIFQSNDLKNHFQQFNWYKPNSNNVERSLSDTDKANIKNIQIFENAQPNNKLNKNDIVVEGTKYFFDQPPEIRENPAIHIINNDNSIEWVGSSEDNFKGSYKIENGFLVVLVNEQDVGNSNYFLNSDWSWPKGVTYNKGIVKYNEPIKMLFPVGDIKIVIDNNSSIILKRQIGSVEWFLNKDYELADALDSQMQKRAIELSKARQRNSDFEDISLTHRNIKMNGDIIDIVSTYEVLMRGNILGVIGHRVNVTVTGQININNNTVQVIDANIK